MTERLPSLPRNLDRRTLYWRLPARRHYDFMDNSSPAAQEPDADPRIYMAAERTFLAWIRTGIALLAFGFVVARFGVFLRQFLVPTNPHTNGSAGVSVWIGLSLIAVGIVVFVISVFRHRSYIRAIDEGHFRRAFGSGLAFAVVALLVLVGIAMSFVLLGL